MVEIEENEYELLKARNLWLACLEEAGVNDWEGIGRAYTIYEEAFKGGV